MNISLHDEEKERTNQTINTKHTMTPYQIPYPKQTYRKISPIRNLLYKFTIVKKEGNYTH